MHTYLYWVGFWLALCYIVMGFDDFLWDVYSLFYGIFHKKDHLDIKEVSKTPYKTLAVMIAAWHEANVIEDVVDNFIASSLYPESMYHVFIGVYPNDLETIKAVKRLEQRHENVHMVIDCMDGPTSKAQNINYIVDKIFEYEQKNHRTFASFTIHDSEDVIHPYELKVTNYLIDFYDALQFPVFPIIYKPTFSNFFKNLTTGTYADEFAENHYFLMRNRDALDAFVPSAGTGLVLSRKVVQSFDGKDILENGSLTEDYKCSLTLYQKKFQLHYVLEKVPRVLDNQKVVYNYIATRSIFPNTFKTAVRQKTRWITGITFQSVQFKDIFKNNNMSFVGRYSLYKDQKAKVGNLLAFIGYPVFIYFIVSLFVQGMPVIYPKGSISWYLSLIVTIEMIERQVFRMVAIYNIYGMRSVFFSTLFPPILPIRIIWGNIINFTATVKAYKQKMYGNTKKTKAIKVKKKEITKKKVTWDKTEHTFLDGNVLQRYHQKLGDILIDYGYITPMQLMHCLEDIQRMDQHVLLGQYMLEKGYINDTQLAICLAERFHMVYLTTSDFHEYHCFALISLFDRNDLEQNGIIPILKHKNKIRFAMSSDTSFDAIKELETKYQIEAKLCYASKDAILKGLQQASDVQCEKKPITLDLLEQEIIEGDEVILVNNITLKEKVSEQEAMRLIGLNISTLNKNSINT